MKVPEEKVYYNHFERRDTTDQGIYAFFAAVFVQIFWTIYLLFPFIDSFDGKLMSRETVEGVIYESPTGWGFLVGIWYVILFVALFGSVWYGLYCLFVLKGLKNEEEISWLETFSGLMGDEKFSNLHLNLVFVATSVILPLLSFIPNELSIGMNVLLLYFITFLLLATYGMRYTAFEKRWEKAVAKEAKKEAKAAKKEAKRLEKERAALAKEDVKKVQANEKQNDKTPTMTTTEQLAQLLADSLHQKEYAYPHFTNEVQVITEEIRAFIASGIKIPIEDYHMIERMLTDEIPAVLSTYEELDAISRKEYDAPFKACLEKMHTQIAARNQGRRNIKKLGAQKVIEIIQNRY